MQSDHGRLSCKHLNLNVMRVVTHGTRDFLGSDMAMLRSHIEGASESVPARQPAEGFMLSLSLLRVCQHTYGSNTGCTASKTRFIVNAP